MTLHETGNAGFIPGVHIKRPRNKTLSKREAMIDILRKAGDSPFRIACTVLMNRAKLSWKWALQDEQRICVEFADLMRTATLNGSYHGIWGHIPNEGKRSQIVALIQQAMGMIPGQPDDFFMGDWGHGVIEFKVPGGKLQDTQECYRDWCLGNGINHAVCYSAEEGMQTLRGWAIATHLPAGVAEHAIHNDFRVRPTSPVKRQVEELATV